VDRLAIGNAIPLFLGEALWYWAAAIIAIVTGVLFTKALRIPAMPIANSNLMAIRIPIDADHHRSEATLDCTYHR